MSNSSLYDYTELLKRKASETLDLLTAQDDEQFEMAFDALLQKAVEQLEENKVDFKGLNENGLSSTLAMALSMPGLEVIREAHSNGHVDLTIIVSHCVRTRRKLGEAKIYRGPTNHIKGLEQLLTRYTTGRESRGLLIVYFKDKNIAGLVKKIREEMDDELPLSQSGLTADHSLKWSFLTSHAHSCGEILEVSHIGCNLYTDQKIRTDNGQNQ